MNIQCYLCNQFKVNGEWDGINHQKDNNASHGLCPECFKKEDARLEKESNEYVRNHTELLET